jgi:hypothetical protein
VSSRKSSAPHYNEIKMDLPFRRVEHTFKLRGLWVALYSLVKYKDETLSLH